MYDTEKLIIIPLTKGLPTLTELWYTFEPLKIGQKINTLLTCFWYIGIDTHFIQLRYDFLSSIIIWYTLECIKVQSVFDTLLSVSTLYQKWINKIRCPILIVSKVYQSSGVKCYRLTPLWTRFTKMFISILSLVSIGFYTTEINRIS